RLAYWGRTTPGGFPEGVTMSRRDLLVCAALGVCLSANAIAGNAPPDYHWQWATIGDVGNPDFVTSPPGGLPPEHIGGVNYAYRIATTEVTWSQYHEFITAFAPFLRQGEWSNVQHG